MRPRHLIPLAMSLLPLAACTSSPNSPTGAVAANAATGKADAQMKAVLDQLTLLGPKPIESLTPTEARRQPSASDAVVALTQARGVVAPDPLPPVGKVGTIAMPGASGNPLQLRVYTPSGKGPFPVVVYFHGGGWVLGTLDTDDSSCRAICSLAKAVVVSVDYRKAPEHPFPAAPEDCYAATQFVMSNASLLDGDAGHVAVAGESAGGNLATVVCLMAKQRHGKMPVHQALIYPVANYAFDTNSYQQNADAKPLNAPMMQWFFSYYLRTPADGTDVLVSPLLARVDELRGLPPATVVTDEIDPLHDEGQAYASKLRSAGVDVQSQDYAGVTHEFFGMGLVVDKAKDAELFVAHRLEESFGK